MTLGFLMYKQAGFNWVIHRLVQKNFQRVAQTTPFTILPRYFIHNYTYMRIPLPQTILVALFIFFTSALIAQPGRTGTDTTRPATGGPGGFGGRSTGPRPYKEIITAKAVTDNGLFAVHKIDDKYFFEIGDSILGRDILVVNRISKAAAGMRNGFFGYAGDQIGQNVIRFEKGPNNRIFLRSISYAEYAKDSASPMFTAVSKSNIQPIAAAFDIKALSRDSAGSVIEMTDYISSDNDILYFNSGLKSQMRVGGQQTDKSYITGVKAFPMNIEVTAVKTYTRAAGPLLGGAPGGGLGGGNITIEVNSSLILLPKDPMQPRYL